MERGPGHRRQTTQTTPGKTSSLRVVWLNVIRVYTGDCIDGFDHYYQVSGQSDGLGATDKSNPKQDEWTFRDFGIWDSGLGHQSKLGLDKYLVTVYIKGTTGQFQILHPISGRVADARPMYTIRGNITGQWTKQAIYS